MSQVISCPNCGKKLALRDELRGRALLCPQCKTKFTTPIEGAESTAEVFDTAANTTSSPGDSNVAFLNSLAPTASATAATAATGSPLAGRSPAPARSAAGAPATAAKSAASAAARTAPSRAKQKNDQMLFVYIGGGVAAAVVVLILIVVGLSSHGGGKKDEKDVRFGMRLTERKRLFEDLLHAADQNGPNKECRDEWRQLGKKWNLSDQQISQVFSEGMDRNWEQPAVPATIDQKEKTNRHEWVLRWNQTHRDPIMSQ